MGYMILHVVARSSRPSCPWSRVGDPRRAEDVCRQGKRSRLEPPPGVTVRPRHIHHPRLPDTSSLENDHEAEWRPWMVGRRARPTSFASDAHGLLGLIEKVAAAAAAAASAASAATSAVAASAEGVLGLIDQRVLKHSLVDRHDLLLLDLAGRLLLPARGFGQGPRPNVLGYD